MSNVVIGGTATGATALPVASTIDGTLDLLPIYTASATATQAISRSTLLGVTGQPADLSSVQNFSNKVVGNTNTITAKDSLLTVQNATDTTKQAKLSLSGLTTGTTRTYTLPDVSDTLVTLGATQILTAKTLTGPTINAPNITNATITADTLSGFSANTTGTVYGMSVTSGVLASAAILNSVNTAAIQTNAVGAANLSASAITLGYAQITTSFSSASTSYVQVTSLTVTVTIPAGGRKIKITAYSPGLSNTNASTGNFLSIWDGTVGSGTQLTYFEVDETSATFNGGATAIAVVTPSAGSKTYNVGFKTTAGTGTVVAMATGPSFILVEAI